jgi:hypothetical protein
MRQVSDTDDLFGTHEVIPQGNSEPYPGDRRSGIGG